MDKNFFEISRPVHRERLGQFQQRQPPGRQHGRQVRRHRASLLLGILQQKESVGAKLLEEFGVTYDRAKLALNLTPKPRLISDLGENRKQFSETAKVTLRSGLAAAHDYNQEICGTEHIILSLLHQTQSRATNLLADMNVRHFPADVGRREPPQQAGPAFGPADGPAGGLSRQPAQQQGAAVPSSTSSASTSRPSPRRTSWTPSSAARPRSSGRSPSSTAARRTTPVLNRRAGRRQDGDRPRAWPPTDRQRGRSQLAPRQADRQP